MAHQEYAWEAAARLKKAGIRVQVDDRNEKLGYRIRESQVKKIPYTFVVGDREAEEGSLSVRKRGEGDLGSKSLDEVLALLGDEISSKRG